MMLRLWTDEWNTIYPNVALYKDLWDNLSLLLMTYPYRVEYAQEVSKAKNLGLSVVPGIRVYETPEDQCWYDKAHWIKKAQELKWLAQYSSGSLSIDIEPYGGSIPLWGTISTQDFNKIEAAMSPFLLALRDLDLTLYIHPADIRYAPYRILLSSYPKIVHQIETWTFSPQDYERGGFDAVAGPLCYYTNEERAWLKDRYPQIPWFPAIRLDAYRHWNWRYLQDFKKLFGVSQAWTDIDKIGDWQKFGTPEWIKGTSINPLNDVKYVWKLPSILGNGVCHVTDKTLDSRIISGTSDIVTSPDWPNQDGDGQFFSGKRFYGWNYQSQGGLAEVYQPPLSFVVDVKPPENYHGIKVVFSSWIDGGYRGYRLLHDTTGFVPKWRWEVCQANHQIISVDVSAMTGWQRLHCGLTSSEIFLQDQKINFSGQLEYLSGWFRIGGSGNPNQQWHDFDNGRIKSLSVWNRKLTEIPVGLYPWTI